MSPAGFMMRISCDYLIILLFIDLCVVHTLCTIHWISFIESRIISFKDRPRRSTIIATWCWPQEDDGETNFSSGATCWFIREERKDGKQCALRSICFIYFKYNICHSVIKFWFCTRFRADSDILLENKVVLSWLFLKIWLWIKQIT